MIHDPGLHPQTAQGVGLKQLLIQLVHPGTSFRALGGGAEGMRSGIGIAEAAGIGGSTHIDRFGDGLVHLHPHDLQHIPHHFGAGGACCVHQLHIREGSGAAVVVDPQGDFSQQMLEGPGQHSGRGHIRRNDGVARLHIFLGQSLMEPPEPGRHFAIVQHMGSLAQLPQP